MSAQKNLELLNIQLNFWATKNFGPAQNIFGPGDVEGISLDNFIEKNCSPDNQEQL